MNHIDVIKFIEEHRRCLLTAKPMFGDSITVEIRPIELNQYGFNCQSGGWSLYKTEMTETPAYFLKLKRKASRKISSININDIETLKPLP